MAVRIIARASALLLRLTGKHLQGPNGLQMPIYPSGRMAAVVSVLEKNEPMLLWRSCQMTQWGNMRIHLTPIAKLPFTLFSSGIAFVLVLHIEILGFTYILQITPMCLCFYKEIGNVFVGFAHMPILIN